MLGCGLKHIRKVKTLPFLPETCSCDSAVWNSRFRANIYRFNQIMKETGMTQREVALKIFLPPYREKVETRFE
jgi:hypothetical protein